MCIKPLHVEITSLPTRVKYLDLIYVFTVMEHIHKQIDFTLPGHLVLFIEEESIVCTTMLPSSIMSVGGEKKQQRSVNSGVCFSDENCFPYYYLGRPQ